MTDPKATIASRIKEAREWKGLTQVHMAQQLGVARQTYLDLETGKTEPKVRLLSAISEITERPLTWFVYGDEGLEILESEYKEEIDRLLQYFSRLPHSARNVILQQSINLAGFMAEYTRALTQKDKP
ncbi:MULTISPECIES: helix-turn-helix transcriptional regulator [Photobacterium]|uniref:Transcriptional regulator n=1 Tax=Photobacterium halotolerans TaxID=265726 RepID=A0A0F5V9I2_9GAMM|nr:MULTISPECIES: helix-turn-helix transcriptional regulator [Photobacterium]KKC98431.1 transcriptional regulator [Photobacterium halotolerans]UIP27924.1 helix-turn-helix transcriptional regulator [Photobacterium sp. TLY01]